MLLGRLEILASGATHPRLMRHGPGGWRGHEGERGGPLKGPPQGTVSRILSAFTRGRPLRDSHERRRDDHSSSPAITDGIQQPTRRLRTGRPVAPPYLALLRAGFCLPPVLPRARCALTAPFHPYSPSRALANPSRRSRPSSDPPRRTPKGGGERYIFCATSPSGCPDRALPGALPCGVRTFLPPLHLQRLGERRSSGSLRRRTSHPQSAIIPRLAPQCVSP